MLVPTAKTIWRGKVVGTHDSGAYNDIPMTNIYWTDFLPVFGSPDRPIAVSARSRLSRSRLRHWIRDLHIERPIPCDDRDTIILKIVSTRGIGFRFKPL